MARRFLEVEDIVCLVFAPIVASALLQRRVNPAPFLVALAIASNIGAAATPVGNPQGMMIAQVARLDFGAYVLWSALPVGFALAAAFGLIALLARTQVVVSPQGQAQHRPPSAVPDRQPLDRVHTAEGLLILAIVVALFFFTPLPKELVALTAAAVHLASTKFRTADLLRGVD